MKADRFLSAAEMRELLRAAYSRDGEVSLLAAVARSLRDPVRPFTPEGTPRPHPLWLAVFLTVLSVVVAFAVFTVLER